MQVLVFLSLEKLRSKNFQFGSKIVNIHADKLQQGSLGAVGYDDEGVKTKEWEIIKDGVLVNYQAIRDQAHILGLNESQGCCYSQSWRDVQFQTYAKYFTSAGQRQIECG